MTDRHVGVGQTYSTVVAAWTVASSSTDVIKIHSGTYTGTDNLNFWLGNKTGITFTNAGEASPTTLDGLLGQTSIFKMYNTVSDIVIQNIDLKGFTSNGIYLSAGTNQVTASDCNMSLDGNNSRGFFFEATTLSPASGVRVTGCNLTGALGLTTTKGFYFKDVLDFHSLQNFTANIRNHYEIEGTCNLIIERSEISGSGPADGDTGILNETDDAASIIVIKSNLIHDIQDGYNSNNATVDGTGIILFNTFYNLNYGIKAIKYAQAIDHNIFAACATYGIDGDNGGNQGRPDGNCFFANGTDIHWYNADLSPVASSPTFTNPNLGNYVLLAGSPCIDATTGSLSASLVTTDYNGNYRPLPQGSTLYTLGAYEYSSSAGNNMKYLLYNGSIVRLISSGDITKITF